MLLPLRALGDDVTNLFGAAERRLKYLEAKICLTYLIALATPEGMIEEVRMTGMNPCRPSGRDRFIEDVYPDLRVRAISPRRFAPWSDFLLDRA